MKELIQALNKRGFQAWPQKANPKRVTLHLEGDEGERYFLTRTAMNEMDDEGNAKYQWSKGKKLKPRDENDD